MKFLLNKCNHAVEHIVLYADCRCMVNNGNEYYYLSRQKYESP